MNFLSSFRAENKLKTHEKVCKDKDFCEILMSSKKKKKHNQYLNSEKMPHIIYVNLVSLIKKIDGCANNQKNSSTKKISKRIPCGIWWFDHIKNIHILHCGKSYKKKFCKSLREHKV